MLALPALLPLRHAVFRSLWIANVTTALGTWMQNTGAGWLMTSLPPNALSDSLIQAATITPALLLASPAGALADMLDRRRFLIATQIATMAGAAGIAAALALAVRGHSLDRSGTTAAHAMRPARQRTHAPRVEPAHASHGAR